MRNIKRGQGIFWLVLLCVCVFLVGSSMVSAQMCQVIRIEDEKGTGGTRLTIFPEKITVPVGTCTVWMNWVTKGDINVSFRENVKECVAASESATEFDLVDLKGGESCYVADKLSKGKTASLYWKTPGTYKYVIEMTESQGVGGQSLYTGKPMAKGVIEVK